MKTSFVFLFLAHLIWECTPPESNFGGETDFGRVEGTHPVRVWISSPDKANLLYGKSLPLVDNADARFQTIQVDSSTTYQTMEGFGYTLTGGSARLLMQMDAKVRAPLLEELFGKGDGSLGISYLRISIGASDLDPFVFSYNDLKPGESDVELKKFSLGPDTSYLIPLLREIRAINPGLALMGSPWSPPAWMKDNKSSKGGQLLPSCYAVYARYFVRYLQAMQGLGLEVGAITIQNEPQHGGNNPSMLMSASQQADFVKKHLGPAIRAAGLSTKIIIWDHNCDNPQYPIAILNDPEAKRFIEGSAFHLYAGEAQAMSLVHDAHPDKSLYFTEQWTGAKGDFGGDLKWHIRNVIIGTTRNWSRVVLEWNLANDPQYNPHTPGGCTECKGALTIDGSAYSRNVSYYIIAHAARFVPPGSRRIASNQWTEFPNVAFQTPEGKKVLIALNDGADPVSFNVESGSGRFVATLNPGNVGTFVW